MNRHRSIIREVREAKQRSCLCKILEKTILPLSKLWYPSVIVCPRKLTTERQEGNLEELNTFCHDCGDGCMVVHLWRFTELKLSAYVACILYKELKWFRVLHFAIKVALQVWYSNTRTCIIGTGEMDQQLDWDSVPSILRAAYSHLTEVPRLLGPCSGFPGHQAHMHYTFYMQAKHL